MSFKGPGVELQEVPLNLLSTADPEGEENIYARTKNQDADLSAGRMSEDLLLYPNLAGRELKLCLGNLAEEQITISVLDMAGRTVYRDVFELKGAGTELRLDLQASGLQQGSYLMRIENKKKELLRVLRFLKH